MIYEMALDISDRLAAKKYPIRVVYAPEGYERQGFDPVITFERDRSGGDEIGPPRGFNRNARKLATRQLGVVVRVYAKSTRDGAHEGDHERDCEQLVDALVATLYEWSKINHAAITYRRTGYVPAKEMGNPERWPGVVYELTLTVARGVFSKDYTGAALPTGTPTGIQNQTQVRYTGQPESDPVIGCGESDP
jgi:hypothetical protein